MGCREDVQHIHVHDPQAEMWLGILDPHHPDGLRHTAVLYPPALSHATHKGQWGCMADTLNSRENLVEVNATGQKYVACASHLVARDTA